MGRFTLKKNTQFALRATDALTVRIRDIVIAVVRGCGGGLMLKWLRRKLNGLTIRNDDLIFWPYTGGNIVLRLVMENK